MKIRHKVKHCLNCNALLDDVYNFCPMCGQENNDNNVSFGTLMHDFFSNYFAFDSKLYNTIVPFFTKPGFITNRFIEGKRVSYAHPLRMYLIISLFYFFVWSLIAKDLVQQTTDDFNRNMPEEVLEEDYLGELNNAARSSIREKLSPETLATMDSLLAGDEELEFMEALRQSTTLEERERIRSEINSELLDSATTNLPQNTQIEIPEINVPDSVEIDSAERDNFVLFRMDYERMNDISKDQSLSDQEVLDSLNMGELTPWENNLARQTIRITRADKEALAGAVVQNLPVMMLLLIPLFALALKLLYIRRKFLYINHVIHGLHLHSFAYLFYGITLIISNFMIESESASNWINFLSFVLVTTYSYVSFLRVYKQGWFKTFVKFNMTGFLYVTLIFMFFTLELLISFYLY